MAVLRVGDEAPDFDLPALVAGVKQRFRLSDQRGKRNIILAFYPFNWEPMTAKQLTSYQVERSNFLAADTEVAGICVESIMNTTAWEREIGPLDFPLCSDFWPHGTVCQSYGVLRDQEPARGASERAVFLVDKNGRIAFREIYRPEDLPDTEPLLKLVPTL